MTILLIGSILTGAVLGSLFKVWILIPASALIFVAVFTSSAYFGHGTGIAVLACALLGTGLQIGYVSGLFLCCIPGLRRNGAETGGTSRQAASVVAERRRNIA